MPERPPLNAKTAQLVSDGLRRRHLESAAAPLRAAGDIGSWADGVLLHREPLTIVVDANVLHDDILYACRKRQRTTLITAANEGGLRIYAAEHVIREVHRDTEEWCEGKCDPRAFRECFARDYLPRIQVLPDGTIPHDILTAEERQRIELLSRSIYGKSDIPSVLLSLALGAPFLSRDTAACEAVYGEFRESSELERWKETLTAGSDASELAKWQFIAIGAPLSVAYGAFKAAQYLYRNAPLLLAGIGVGAALLALRDPKATTSALGAAGKKFLEIYYEIDRPYEAALGRFRAAAPAVRALEDLQGGVDKRALLLRACLRTLAHAPQTNLSAQALADALPIMGVAQSAPIVRETLRANDCFSTYGNRKWRVGHTFAYPPPGAPGQPQQKRPVKSDRPSIGI